MLVGAQVVNPEPFGPGLFRCGFAVKKKDIGFDALGVKQTGGQAQQGVDIAFMKQLAANALAGPAFKQYVVRHHDGRAAVDFEQGFDMLDKVKLFVGPYVQPKV